MMKTTHKVLNICKKLLVSMENIKIKLEQGAILVIKRYDQIGREMLLLSLQKIVNFLLSKKKIFCLSKGHLINKEKIYSYL